MINLLKKIFACKHKHTKEGFKQATRFDKPIVIDYKECLDCGRMLRCKVSFLAEVKPVVPPVVSVSQMTISTESKDVVTGNQTVMPTVSMTMDLSENPGQNRKEAEPPAPVKAPEPAPAPAPVEPPKVEPLRDADKVEQDLNQDTDEGPLASRPDPQDVVPTGAPAEAGDVDEEDPADPGKDAMVEGMSFLKESKVSINRRRKALARRREKAMEQLKKTGKATIKVKGKKGDGIPYLDDPDGGGNLQDDCT